jgi:hypothetical protein
LTIDRLFAKPNGLILPESSRLLVAVALNADVVVICAMRKSRNKFKELEIKLNKFELIS